MKLAVIGAGSTYTPELVEGLIHYYESLPVQQLVFMDIDARKNEIAAGMARRMLDAANVNMTLTQTDDLCDAVHGAKYVLAQIRVGFLNARIRDEKIPLKYGLIGQETVGAGGFMNAMRTIPEMLQVAKTMEREAPEAFLINFSNPSGLVTQALLQETQIQTIGLCNVPITMHKAAEKLLGQAEFNYDFIGLNHLCWMTGVYLGDMNLLQAVLARPEDALQEMGMQNIPDMEYDPQLLQAAGGIPCGYLNYYYFPDRMLKKCQNAKKTRGEEVQALEEQLLELYQNPNLATKPAQLEQRGGAYYSTAAISLLDAIENDRQTVHVVNVRNRDTFGFLGPMDVVETRCKIGRSGAIPLSPNMQPSAHIQGYMQMLKNYERLAVQAGLYGDYPAALSALMLNPLVGDYKRAKAVLDDMLEANRSFLPQFAAHFARKEGR